MLDMTSSGRTHALRSSFFSSSNLARFKLEAAPSPRSAHVRGLWGGSSYGIEEEIGVTDEIRMNANEIEKD